MFLPGARRYAGSFWQASVIPHSQNITFSVSIAIWNYQQTGASCMDTAESVSLHLGEQSVPTTYQDETRTNGGCKVVIDLRNNRLLLVHKDANGADAIISTVTPIRAISSSNTTNMCSSTRLDADWIPMAVTLMRQAGNTTLDVRINSSSYMQASIRRARP